MRVPYDQNDKGQYGQQQGQYPNAPYQQQQQQYRPPGGNPSQGYGAGSPYGAPSNQYNQYNQHQSYNQYAPPPQQNYQQGPNYGYGAPQQPPQHPAYGAPPSPQPGYQQQNQYYQGGAAGNQGGEAASYLNQHPQSPPQGGPNGGPPEDERGVMGALAGGAAGAWAGHKVHHGFLGAMGGAFAGHKLQDAISDHRKESEQKKYEQQHPASPPPQYSQYNQRPASPRRHSRNLAGNFSASATQITLDRDYDLVASCYDMGGNPKLTSISLNDCLTNEDGHFRWARGGNFGASARNVRLVDGGKVLEAELANCNGQWIHGRIELDEKISNNDGNLILL